MKKESQKNENCVQDKMLYLKQVCLLDGLVQGGLLCCMIMALKCRAIWVVVSILKLINMVAGKNNCGRNLMLWASNINIKPCRIFAN